MVSDIHHSTRMEANSMKTSSAKAKGRTLQKETVLAIKKMIEARSGAIIGEYDVKGAIMGERGVDIKLSAFARSYFPYSVECKNVESLNVWSAIEQMEANVEAGTKPLLVFRRNHKPAYVIMRAEDFFKS